MVSITAKGPIVFLKLAEKETGEYDGVIFPSVLESDIDYYDFVDSGNYLNYTKMKSFTDDAYNVAPRVQIDNLYAARTED